MGSSPLTRGARGTEARRDGLRRDHPRSRGVHERAARRASSVMGSSPLTRGAHGHGGGPHDAVRIIPAHAGCTGFPMYSFHLETDHPRSRGVHPIRIVFLVSVVGSSPLTRGALALHDRPNREGGIIPAHAGCTGSTFLTFASLPDHPRSRGVHPRVVALGFWCCGSSPLTRGALSQHPPSGGLVGIIPAHAGCTSSPKPCPSSSGDHPRSRGVHDPHPWRVPPTGGSSPLTRGARRP